MPLVEAHAVLINGIIQLDAEDGSSNDGFILGDGEATLYSGFTIFALIGQVSQEFGLDGLIMLDDQLEPDDPDNGVSLDDVKAALIKADTYMETGFAALGPHEAGEARTLHAFHNLAEKQFADFIA
jgi:hypothetical protein